MKFVRFHAPYNENEIAGFLAHRAKELVEVKRVAVYNDLKTVDLDAMDRPALVAYAREHLGLVDEPPADVDEGAIREALRAASLEGNAPPSPGLDELDAMDRAHLEAFAKAKVGMAMIDPAMTDKALRAAIRAHAEAALNFCTKKAGRRG